MSDQELIDTIAAHQPDDYGFRCTGCDWKPVNSSVTDATEFAAHQIAALRGKYAIIQLPPGIRHGNNCNWSFYEVSASVGTGIVRIMPPDDIRHTPEAARKFAAEILAAADKADGITTETTAGEGK